MGGLLGHVWILRHMLYLCEPEVDVWAFAVVDQSPGQQGRQEFAHKT